MYLQYKLSVPPTSLINRKEYNAFIDAFHKRLFVGQHQVCIPEDVSTAAAAGMQYYPKAN
jgi:hypothetical protein